MRSKLFLLTGTRFSRWPSRPHGHNLGLHIQAGGVVEPLDQLEKRGDEKAFFVKASALRKGSHDLSGALCRVFAS